MRLRVGTFLQRLARPFQGLSHFERLMCVMRFTSSFLIFLFSIVIYLAPYISPRTISMSRLNTYSKEISQGIFEKLYNSVESISAGSNNGVGLTTSEIMILTAYTLTQIKNVPQYIIFSLYGNCIVDFATSIDYSTINDTDSRRDNDNDDVLSQIWVNATDSGLTYDCSNYGPSYFFDYKSILSTIGLDIIIDYVYTSGPTDAYTHYIHQLETLKRNCVYLAYVSLFVELEILILTIWYYNIKNRSINPFAEKLLVHIVSFLALFVMIIGLVCNISLAVINYSIQKRIRSELQSFGFSYHLNKAWFTLLWFQTFWICVSCLAWSGFEWCLANDNGGDDNDSINVNIMDNLGFIKSPDNELPSKKYNLSYDSMDDEQFEGGNDGEGTNVGMVSGYNSEEDYELQSISLRSTSSSQSPEAYSVKRVVIPSTMQF